MIFGCAGVDWRAKLENQRGAVLATELKNNANKLAKWTAAAVIAGADMIRIGYVSRAHARDNQNHTILGTQVCFSNSFSCQYACLGMQFCCVAIVWRVDHPFVPSGCLDRLGCSYLEDVCAPEHIAMTLLAVFTGLHHSPSAQLCIWLIMSICRLCAPTCLMS